jgi:neurotransmitter:Na+ symporter, NSS family
MTFKEAVSMKSRGQWGGKLGFILAAAGGAVGLGNIWKFPYVVGQNGGGAFILLYAASIILAGLPLLAAEIYIGKKSQLNPVGAFAFFQKGKLPFKVIGYMGVLTGVIILSYYSVIAGWTTHYLFLSIKGLGSSEAEISRIFSDLYSSPWLNIFWHTIFMTATVIVISKGVRGGIEAVTKILMPLLFIILAILMVYSLTLEGAGKALSFLFYPDFSVITPKTALEALGTSFFTLSLGMGAMITYGSYLNEKVSIPVSSLQIAVIDTIIALMAGLTIFPIVFSNSLEASAGPSLIFETLPVLFSKMPGGQFFSISFFLLLIFAALTSAISLLEVVVAFAVDEHKISRKKATIGAGVIIWSLGLLSAISSLKAGEKPFLDFLDGITTCYLMPIGGLLTILVFGWTISKVDKESEFGNTTFFKVFSFIVKYISPILLAIVVLYSLELV